MMAGRLEIEIDDIAECSICVGLYDDPKLLPCAHTFCCKCIRRYVDGEIAGDKSSCPICRQQFTIPTGGITQFPGNYLIAKLVELRKGLAQKDKKPMCDICSETNETEANKLAKWYC